MSGAKFKLDQRVKVVDAGSEHHGRTGTVVHAYGQPGEWYCTVVFDHSSPPLPRTERLPETALQAADAAGGE